MLGLYLDCKLLGLLAARAEVVYPKEFDSVAFSLNKSVGNILVAIKEMCCSVDEVKDAPFLKNGKAILYLPSIWVQILEMGKHVVLVILHVKVWLAVLIQWICSLATFPLLGKDICDDNHRHQCHSQFKDVLSTYPLHFPYLLILQLC